MTQLITLLYLKEYYKSLIFYIYTKKYFSSINLNNRINILKLIIKILIFNL